MQLVASRGKFVELDVKSMQRYRIPTRYSQLGTRVRVRRVGCGVSYSVQDLGKVIGRLDEECQREKSQANSGGARSRGDFGRTPLSPTHGAGHQFMYLLFILAGVKIIIGGNSQYSLHLLLSIS